MIALVRLSRENRRWVTSLCKEHEHISVEKIEHLIGEYLYTQKLPQDQAVADLLPETPRLLKRQGIIDRIKSAIENIVDIFEW